MADHPDYYPRLLYAIEKMAENIFYVRHSMSDLIRISTSLFDTEKNVRMAYRLLKKSQSMKRQIRIETSRLRRERNLWTEQTTVNGGDENSPGHQPYSVQLPNTNLVSVGTQTIEHTFDTITPCEVLVEEDEENMNLSPTDQFQYRGNVLLEQSSVTMEDDESSQISNNTDFSVEYEEDEEMYSIQTDGDNTLHEQFSINTQEIESEKNDNDEVLNTNEYQSFLPCTSQTIPEQSLINTPETSDTDMALHLLIDQERIENKRKKFSNSYNYSRSLPTESDRLQARYEILKKKHDLKEFKMKLVKFDTDIKSIDTLKKNGLTSKQMFKYFFHTSKVLR